jgi:IS4 transposase
MHPLIQQRRDVLGALMVRSQMAREEFARLVNLVMPEKPVRYQVKNVGPKAYHIIDLVTGKTCGFRFEHASAVDYAIQLEEKANRLSGGAQ